MVKGTIGIVIFLIVALVGSAMLVNWAFETDMHNAENHYDQLGAKPEYTYRTHYICVTPDGRVVE